MIKYNSVVEAINIGDLDFRMTLYEADTCFASQPGQLTKSPESVQQSIHVFHRLEGHQEPVILKDRLSNQFFVIFLKN